MEPGVLGFNKAERLLWTCSAFFKKAIFNHTLSNSVMLMLQDGCLSVIKKAVPTTNVHYIK